MLLLKQLNKGDIFQDDKHSWDGVFRFHSCQIIDGRLLVKLIGINYQGDVDSCSANSFTWRELNHQAYIPVYYRCEFRKSKGLPCIPVSNHRIFLPSNLNPINLSDKYCNRNDYADLL